MPDPKNIAAPPGEVGWHVVTFDDFPLGHRCSRKGCLEPAVIYYLGRTYHRPRRWSRRFVCDLHLNDYQTEYPWWIDGDRILRERLPYELEGPD